MIRESIGSEFQIICIFFHEVNKRGNMWVEILISLFYLEVWRHIFFNSVFSVTISHITINKIRKVHHLLQEMRSINPCANKDWFSLNELVGWCCELMFELWCWFFMFDYLVVIVDLDLVWMGFYIKVKSIIGSFHVNWPTIRLIQRWPVVPLGILGRFESFHKLRWILHYCLNVERTNLLFTSKKVAIDHGKWLLSCLYVTHSSINMFVSKPQSSLPVKKRFSFSQLLLDVLPLVVWGLYKLGKILLIVLHAVLTRNKAIAPKFFIISKSSLFKNTNCTVQLKGIICCSHAYAASSNDH